MNLKCIKKFDMGGIAYRCTEDFFNEPTNEAEMKKMFGR